MIALTLTKGRLHLKELLLHLFKDRGCVREIKDRRLFADLGRTHQSRQLARNSIQLVGDGIATLLLAFDRLPIRKDLRHALGFSLTENVRMTMDHFSANAVGDLTKCRTPLLLLEPCVKHDLEKRIAQLLLQKVGVAVINGLDDLVGFFDQIRAQGLVRLFTVPRASPGRAKQLYYRNQVLNIVFIFF